jgi:hypothetical protein
VSDKNNALIPAFTERTLRLTILLGTFTLTECAVSSRRGCRCSAIRRLVLSTL